MSAALPAIIESFGGIENILIRLTQNANQNQLKSMDEIIQNEKIKYDQQLLQENTDDKLLNDFLEDNPSDLQLTKPEICNLSVCTFKVLYVTSVFRYLCLMFWIWWHIEITKRNDIIHHWLFGLPWYGII